MKVSNIPLGAALKKEYRKTMDELLLKTRELGALLQKEPCFKAYIEAKKDNDADEELQEHIGQFNLIRLSMDEELNKEEKSEERLKSLNEELRGVYGKIMENESMQRFKAAKKELDGKVNAVYSLLIRCAGGEDPETAEFSEGCTGNCSSCGGCH